MWQKSEKPVTKQVTKSLVQEFAEMTPAPHDRPLSERRLQVYERVLANKEFRPVTWASAFCESTGETYRVNGKHTSVMLSNLPELPEFFVTVERYVCETIDDVAKLYATFDSSLGVRKAADINLAFAATMPEIANLPARLIHFTVTAASWQKWGPDVSHHTPAERAELLLDHGDFALWLYDLVPTALHKHIYRSPVIAAMLASWSKSKAAATEFWKMVRDESHSKNTDPTRVLARFLVRVSVDHGRGSKPGRLRSTGKEMYAKCLHAWNAWRTGAATDLKFYANAKLPAAK